MTDREKYEYTDALKRNVIEVMQTLIEAAQVLNIPILGEEEKEGFDDINLEQYASDISDLDVASEGGTVLISISSISMFKCIYMYICIHVYMYM